MGAPIHLEPHEALDWCVARAAGEVAYCDARVAELEHAQAIGRPTITVRRAGKPDENGEPGDDIVEVRELTPVLHVWINARREALDRLARFSKMAADANVDERRVRVDERQVEALAVVVNAVMADLVAAGLSDELRRLAGDSFRRHAALLDRPALEATAVEARA